MLFYETLGLLFYETVRKYVISFSLMSFTSLVIIRVYYNNKQEAAKRSVKTFDIMGVQFISAVGAVFSMFFK